MFAYCGNNPATTEDPSGHIMRNTNLMMTDGPGANPINAYRYHRYAAVHYARQYYKYPNYDYPYYANGDCTNFVSQCVHEGGGLPQTDEWSIKEGGALKHILAYLVFGKTYKWSPSNAWSVASENYKYMTETLGYTHVDIFSISEIAGAVNSSHIQVGDLIYFESETGINHAAIITKVSNGKIYYTQHTGNKADAPLVSMGDYCALHIVIME